ncbi:MAG: DUF2079 domain-containing protein, partial [Dehalococcoidia bacterium]|nr:DUF2079 domain-containing protein [Dehalococcoidia bacterium]
ALLLSPLLHFINLFEYHEVAPAVAAVLFVFWAIEARRGRLAVALTLLMLSVKEEMAIVGVMLGVYAALTGRQWRLGLILGLLSASWGVVVMGVIMPRLSLAGDTFYYVRRYSQYGDDIPSIAVNLARQPWVVVGELIAPPRPQWYVQLVAPLAALPLLAPSALMVAAPVIGYLALGNSPAQYSIEYHYAAPLLPILMMAAVAGAARLRAWRVPTWAIAGALLTATLASMYAWSPLPGMRAHDPAKYIGGLHATIVNEFLAAIPPDASVSAGRNLVSRLALRERVYNFPTIRDAQYVVIDNKGLVPPGFFEVDNFALSAFVRNPAYRLVDAEDGVWLFVRDAPPPPPPTVPLTAQFGDSIRLLGYDLTPGRVDGALALRLWWQADARVEERYTVFVHLLDAAGVRVWQHDSEPLDGLFITTEWPTGRPIPDRRVIAVQGLPPGVYRLVIGLYEWGGGDRLPVPGTAGGPLQDSVTLGPIHLPR